MQLSRPVRSVRVELTKTGLRYRALPLATGGHFISIESAPVESLTDISQQEFIDDLDAWTRRGRLQITTFALSALVIGGVAALHAPTSLLIALGAVACIALFAARVIELRRREYFLLFDVDESATARFEAVGTCLGRLARSGILNSVRLEHIHGDWKRHAGATTTIHSDDALIERAHPRHVASNIEPAPIRVRAQGKSLYFFPDRLLVEDRGRKAALSYDALTISCQDVSMRWFGAIPGDAKIVGQSWRYVNKNGTPDRRFNNNHVVQIIMVAEFHIQSRSGLDIILQSSATKAAAEAAEELRALGRLLGNTSVGAADSQTTNADDPPNLEIEPVQDEIARLQRFGAIAAQASVISDN